ncbi:MAG: HD domain-containing protein [Ezakiella coagulans]
MERKLSSLWAKKNRNASGMCEWLPLSVHLNDTMAICRLIWEH